MSKISTSEKVDIIEVDPKDIEIVEPESSSKSTTISKELFGKELAVTKGQSIKRNPLYW